MYISRLPSTAQTAMDPRRAKKLRASKCATWPKIGMVQGKLITIEPPISSVMIPSSLQMCGLFIGGYAVTDNKPPAAQCVWEVGGIDTG